jgi:glucose-6-phosphate 1-dehydrogenase
MTYPLVILGASGDLTSRYLLPALARLHEAREFPQESRILGVARDEWDTEVFRHHIAEKLQRHAAHIAQSSRDAVTSALEYCRADITNQNEIANAIGQMEEPVVAYLALPPAVFAPAIASLAGTDLPQESRVVIEKPFGENLASAQALNRLVHDAFPEHTVFRVDHFLGKQTVLNILGLRFANRVFEPVWNCQHVASVEIIWDETLALEGRATYYDSAGALRDMIQNHLLQLLCLIGMEPPFSLDEHDFRNRKVEVLRAVHRLSPEEVVQRTVRGRYSAGRLSDQELPAYVDEEGVDPTRGTETFAQVTLHINNWRWAGVPFILRSGKALGQDRKEIAIHFKPVPHVPFRLGAEPSSNRLRLTLDPDRVALGVNINGQGDPFALESIELDAALAPEEVTAYGRLLLDVFNGDPTLFIRDDEAEELWRIVEPIYEAWAQNRVSLLEYPAGSDGPQEALS